MNSIVQVVDTSQALQELITSLPLRDGGPPTLFVDLEGDNLSRHGTIALVTILVQPRKTVFLVDVSTMKHSAFTTQASDGRTLQSILQSDEVKKGFFDIRNDSDALFSLYGVKVAGIIDIQLMELAVRSSNKRCINGLARCIEQDAGLSYSDRQIWRTVKDKGKRLYAPELGGSYAVFGARPLSDELKIYCAQDVALMPALFESYRPKICDAWWLKIHQEIDARIRLSQSASFNGQGRHMALGPTGWTHWHPAPHELHSKVQSAAYAVPAPAQSPEPNPTAPEQKPTTGVSESKATAPTSGYGRGRGGFPTRGGLSTRGNHRQGGGVVSAEDYDHPDSDGYEETYDSDRDGGVDYGISSEDEAAKDLSACDSECGYCGRCIFGQSGAYR